MHRFFLVFFFGEIDEGLICVGKFEKSRSRSGMSVAIVDKILHHIIEALANQSDIHTPIHKKVSTFSTANNWYLHHQHFWTWRFSCTTRFNQPIFFSTLLRRRGLESLQLEDLHWSRGSSSCLQSCRWRLSRRVSSTTFGIRSRESGVVIRRRVERYGCFQK